MRQMIAIALLLFALLTPTAWGQPAAPTVEITLEVGATKTVPELENVPDASLTNTASPKGVASVAGKVITGAKIGTEVVTFTRTDGGTPSTLNANVTVTPIDLDVELILNGVRTPVTDEKTPVTVVSGDVYELQTSGHNADGTPRALTVQNPSSSPADLVSASATKISINHPHNDGLVNPPPAVATVTFGLPDGTTHSLKFRVVEDVKAVRIDAPVTLPENSDITIPITVTGEGNGTYQSISEQFATLYQYNCDPSFGTSSVSVTPLNGTTIRTSLITAANSPKVPGRLKCNAQPLGRLAKGASAATKDVAVVPSGGSIAFAPATLTLVAGQTGKVQATVLSRLGQRNDAQQVSWSLVGDGADAVVLTPGPNNELSIATSTDTTKLPANGLLKLRATAAAADSNATPLVGDILVKVFSPAGFVRVSGSLELLDYQTARDLYGTQTANDFFAAKITLLNDLQDEPNRELVGASILVFSSSLEIGVNMQKLASRSRKPPRMDEPEWAAVTFGDLRTLGLPVDYPLKRETSRPHAQPVPSAQEWGETQPVYTCDDIWLAEQDIELTKDQEEGKTPEQIEALRAKLRRGQEAQVKAARLRQLHYRPYPYDLVVKSFDPRDNRTTRSMTFRALTFAGSVASFIAGVPNFKTSDEFIAVNEKFGNILIPALGALWPNLKETQRQNLVSDTMHPIEEIPYASSLTKVIFLPKYPFQGFKTNHWFRISEICPYNFHVQVAVTRKDSRQTVNVTPPGS